ncbi:hypothetical protein BpHYR1_004647 [Brachionus plicatilis]|uniref:Uncharacterized protein n=1 Tax=Brachionus plicatilis TaxID=10195 RepID=A0A3M7S7A6_BRAPC|nr:hypothetical protein BpHYR1_004647 [Brachionus plicatilis]
MLIQAFRFCMSPCHSMSHLGLKIISCLLCFYKRKLLIKCIVILVCINFDKNTTTVHTVLNSRLYHFHVILADNILSNKEGPLDAYIELDFSDNNDSFNIIESLIKSENLERMRKAKRDEQERVERAIAERIEALKYSDIKNEAKGEKWQY